MTWVPHNEHCLCPRCTTYANSYVSTQYVKRIITDLTGWPKQKVEDFLQKHEAKVVFAMKDAAVEALKALAEQEQCGYTPSKAATTFVADNVLSLRKNWTRKDAETFLNWAKKQIKDDMTERGWDSIDTLLFIYENDSDSPERREQSA